MTITIGFEGTAHTLGVGIVDGKKVFADEKSIYSPEKGGLHPRDSSQHMSEHLHETLEKALDVSKKSWDDIEALAFSQGPGMGPCLRTVATAARTLALYHMKPLIGVNHCVAHIQAGLTVGELKDPLTLYVSGGNTQVTKLEEGRYRIFGETIDIGVGNLLDKFGREVGLAHPAGPKIEMLASEGKEFIELPYTVKGTDLSFSGLYNAATWAAEKHPLEDVCYSLQETAFAMLCEVTERALAHLKAKEILLTGGVANNKRLSEMVESVADEHGATYYVPKGLCSDNGAMIAMLGEAMHKAGLETKIEDSQINQGWRTDQVDVVW
ncbi:MAG: bifunctional N(6)-L-threonylcarbamoyladenine synthase/serine/threonine protein kinase [Candidatus Altiarchaeota archaeon]